LWNSGVRPVKERGFCGVKPLSVGSLGPTAMGELIVTGGVMVPPAVTVGKKRAGTFGMLAPSWVTPLFCSRREKKKPAPLRRVHLRERL